MKSTLEKGRDFTQALKNIGHPERLLYFVTKEGEKFWEATKVSVKFILGLRSGTERFLDGGT